MGRGTARTAGPMAFPSAPEPAGALAARGAGYPREYYAARGGPMFRLEVGHLVSLAAPSRGDRVLELGCGAGLLLDACRRRGDAALVMGLDVNPEAVALARRVAPVALADATCLPVADGAFHAVIAQHLIEHLERPDEALREWRRILAPGGRVAVATPNAAYPDPAVFDDRTHRHIYGLRDIRGLFETAGFKVERCYTLMPYLRSRWLTWALAKFVPRLLPALQLLPCFRARGLTIFLSATRTDGPADCQGGAHD